MACPFVNEVVDVEEQIIQRLYLYERYLVSSQSVIYLNLFCPHILKIKHRGFALSLKKIYALPFDSLPTAVFLITSGRL